MKNSIKLSNLSENKDELIERAKTARRNTNIIRKVFLTNLIKSLKEDDYYAAVNELVMRFEAYCQLGILNYKRDVVKSFMDAYHKTPNKSHIVSMICEKYYPEFM